MANFKSLLNRLSLTVRVSASAGAVVVVAAGYFFVFHSDLDTRTTQALSKKAGLKQSLAAAQRAEKEYRKDLAELAEREARQKTLSKVLPDKTEYPAFLSAVQSAANVSGVSLAAWTPRKRVPDEFYSRVPMKVELTGRFHQIARFFYNVGQLDRIINMEDISMTKPVVTDEEVILTTSALATAFHVSPADDSAGKGKRKSRKRRGK